MSDSLTSVKGKSGLRVHFDNGKAQFFSCPCRDCQGKHWDQAYSYKHAQELGWYITNGRDFSPTGYNVAVCNTCYSAWLVKHGYKK